MDTLLQIFNLVFHVDQTLAAFIAAHGQLIYALLFAIVFVETGLVIMPFLPGDSLLFIVGAFCATGHLDFALSCGILFLAAVSGDQLNYSIGKYFGPKVFKWENSRFFNKKAFDKAHGFYEQYGGITIVLARFMPFIRTFVPFVAGVASMTRSKFVFFNVLGAAIWVFGIIIAGYFFGNLPWVKENLEKIIWGLILIPGLLAIYGAWKAQREQKST
ncbi:MAG: VTT domain-containing protein [Brachymonas sp.]|jgi:membrane-associated protein